MDYSLSIYIMSIYSGCSALFPPSFLPLLLPVLFTDVVVVQARHAREHLLLEDVVLGHKRLVENLLRRA